MKSTKKLLMATLMLVVAFVAATSATFAWFTMRQEATVSDIELQAAAVGEDLQISLTGTEGTYEFNVTLPTLYGKLEPVTFDKTEQKFYQLAVDETSFKFKQVEATEASKNVLNGTSETSVDGYLEFDLWFRTTNTEVATLNFDVTSVFEASVTEEAEVLETLRIMFLPTTTASGIYTDYTDSTTLVYEHQDATTSTYGTGDYFVQANKFIAAGAFNYETGSYPFQPASASEYGFLKEDGSGFVLTEAPVSYQLDDTFVANSKYTTKLSTDAVSNVLKISDFTSASDLQVRVIIWIEGWDGDTTNNAAIQSFIAGLKFSAATA